jgi:hypothetical protein
LKFQIYRVIAQGMWHSCQQRRHYFPRRADGPMMLHDSWLVRFPFEAGKSSTPECIIGSAWSTQIPQTKTRANHNCGNYLETLSRHEYRKQRNILRVRNDDIVRKSLRNICRHMAWQSEKSLPWLRRIRPTVPQMDWPSFSERVILKFYPEKNSITLNKRFMHKQSESARCTDKENRRRKNGETKIFQWLESFTCVAS